MEKLSYRIVFTGAGPPEEFERHKTENDISEDCWEIKYSGSSR